MTKRNTIKIIHLTNKKKTRKKKQPQVKTKIKKNSRKTCLSNEEMIDICKTGQFNTLSASSLFERESLKKNEDITGYKNKDSEQYKKHLIRRFNQISHGKDLNYTTPLLKNDFYSFINKEWIDSISNKIQKKYYVQTDNFRVVQEKVYYEVIGYMKEYIKANPTEKKAIGIKNVYNSIINDTPTSIRIKNSLDILSRIDSTIEKGNMYDLLADANSNEVISWGSPIVWTMEPDEKNVKKYISHLGLGQLSISDYMVYIEDEADNIEAKKYKKLVKQEYFNYIKAVFKAYLGTKPHLMKDIHPQDIWDVELEMLEAMGCNVMKKAEDPNYYNLVSKEELERTYDFDFTQFAKKIGFKNTPKKVVVQSLNGLKCMTTLLKEKWNTPKWRTYWLYIYYRQLIRFEPSLRHIHYKFYNKLLEGQPVIMPLDIYPIFVVSLCFNTFLSEQYMEHNQNPLYVGYVNNLLNDLKYIFIRKLKQNTWLSPKTKAYAIEKMEKLEIVVGRPDKLREDPLLNYSANYDSWYNISLLVKWKHERFVELEGQEMVDIPIVDWKNFKIIGTQNYMVNAYYRPTSNSIYVPGAYLQSPFIDLNERGIEYNLAYIGYTLGHELSHALDDNGSRFDKDGNLNNWWTDHDRKIYNGKIKDVIKQYETFAKRDGIDFDASMSVGEDLADISGLALVEEYLVEFSKSNDNIDRIKKIKLEKFYTEIAIQGRQKVFGRAIKSQLRINPHPLEKYRVNCPLSRLELFRNIFNVKKDDGMYWHNNDTIW
jgi:putative endopeptidase